MPMAAGSQAFGGVSALLGTAAPLKTAFDDRRAGRSPWPSAVRSCGLLMGPGWPVGTISETVSPGPKYSLPFGAVLSSGMLVAGTS